MKVPHLGHVVGDVTADATTVDEAIGDILADAVEAVARVVVDVVYTACMALFKLIMGVVDNLLIVVNDVVSVQPVRDMNPSEFTNMFLFKALERAQESPQSFRLKDFAPQNMKFMLVTCDTSHFQMSMLNDVASLNM